MGKYSVTFTQMYVSEYQVSFEVESDLSPEEFEDKISDISGGIYRLARLSEDELVNDIGLEGLVEDSYSEWEGQSEENSDTEYEIEIIE